MLTRQKVNDAIKAARELPKPVGKLAKKRDPKLTAAQKHIRVVKKKQRLMGDAVVAQHTRFIARMHWLEQRVGQTKVGSHERDVLAAEYLVLQDLVGHLEKTYSPAAA